jgi:LuxR family transcriptional regulator, quorum-sensing system regulator CinR
MVEKLAELESDKIGARIMAACDVTHALRIVCDSLHINHMTYLMAQNTCLGVVSPFVSTTYPAEWISRYVMAGYANRDPVVARGLCSRRPFFWSELTWKSPEAQEFFTEASLYGIGNLGYCVPISDNLGLHAMISFNHSGSKIEWRQKISGKLTLISSISDRIHQKVVQHLNVVKIASPLSPREIECLAWAALGKDAMTIAQILEISDHTVRDHFRLAKKKLGCTTIIQAVYKAGKLRLIDA